MAKGKGGVYLFFYFSTLVSPPPLFWTQHCQASVCVSVVPDGEA